MSARVLLTGTVLAALLLASGCGRERKKFVGTWSLDMGFAGEFGQGASVTMTLNEDGTGSMTHTQTVSAELPASTTAAFQWEIDDGEIALSFSEAGTSMTQTMKYEFDEEGALSLGSGREQAMKYWRVE
jgi:hypothetical protein